MIHANRIVTVGEQESIIDRPIILYRGDREVEIEFTLVGNEFMFSKEGNVIKSVNASHGQLVLNTPSGEHMFSELAECHEGKVVFVVTKEMIDEFIEMGFYSFQIRLYDSAEMKSRVTIPPVMNGFDIRNPIAAEDEANAVDQGVVGYARIFKDQSNEELPTFNWQDNYNKTEWVHHDVITENKLNKIEDALYSINTKAKASDTFMLNTLDNVKKDADTYVKEHIAEVEANAAEFERNLNTDVQRFKIDTNAAVTAYKNEVSEVVDGFSSQLAHMENNKVYLRVINPEYTTEQIQEILYTKHNGVLNVVFSKGEYNLNSLRIKKNTHIVLDEAIINVTSNHLFYNFETNDTFKGYEGNGNIVIEGGTVNGHLISMMHAKDVIIKNVTMQRCSNDHYIEICASNNILIDNCVIDGVKLQEQGRNYVECIQLDVCEYDAFPWISSESLMFDKTPNKNITIKNCNFKNTSTLHELYTAIGSHVVDSDNPSKDINIIACSFYGSQSHAINVMGWNNVNIKDCLFEDCILAICSNTYARTLVVDNCYFKSCDKVMITKNGGGYNFIIKNNIIEDTVDSIGELNDVISLKFNYNYLTKNNGRINFKRTRYTIIDNNIFIQSKLNKFNHILNIDGEIEYVYAFTICNNFFGNYSEGGFDEYYCINLNNGYTYQIKQHSNNVGSSYNHSIAYNNNPANLYPINKLDEFIITTSHDLKYNDSFITLDKKVNLNFRIDLNTTINQNTWTKIASTSYTGEERTLYVSSSNYDRMICIINESGINIKSESTLAAGEQLRFLGAFTIQ